MSAVTALPSRVVDLDVVEQHGAAVRLGRDDYAMVPASPEMLQWYFRLTAMERAGQEDAPDYAALVDQLVAALVPSLSAEQRAKLQPAQRVKLVGNGVGGALAMLAVVVSELRAASRATTDKPDAPDAEPPAGNVAGAVDPSSTAPTSSP